MSSGSFQFVLAGVGPTQPWPVRNDAATVLSKAKLGPAQLAALADALRTVGPAELPKLLNRLLRIAPMKPSG